MTTLYLSSKGLEVNSVLIELPVSIDILKRCLNTGYKTFKLKNNTVFTWDDLGILGYSANGELIDSITLELQPDTFEFSPKQKFSGTFYFNDQEIVNYYKTHKAERIELFEGDDCGALVQDNVSAWFDINDTIISAIEISTYEIYNRLEGIPEDKYIIKPLEEEEIVFADFGFKLSIIEELMYVKGLLEPQFDIHEFVRWYKARDIDINEEGYEPIAEVVNYFKDLPIPKRLASEITEIYQDGGNDIYMNLSPFSGGAVDYWDIESAMDAKQFPNLKKVTLCYATDKAFDEFEQMSIETEWL